MQVVLNGKQEVLSSTITLLEFLKNKGFTLETIIVEFNGKILDKHRWSHTVLQDKDCLEVLKFVGGG